MPTYDYVCDCGHKETRRDVPVADRDANWCICGKRMARVWTSPAIQFKGPGFYATDYKRKDSKP